MKDNPVLRESLDIFFGEDMGLPFIFTFDYSRAGGVLFALFAVTGRADVERLRESI